MVGDEAEYIDYVEQKMHRVRKNLFPVDATSKTINGITFTVNADKSVTCNGTNNGTSTLIFEFNPSGVLLEIGESYIVTGCPEGGKMSGGYTIQYNNGASWRYEIGHGATFTVSGSGVVRPRILISRGVTVDNLTFYPMIRKADIEDATYEPYIENTNLDVTLPALSTIKGTNTISVNTSIQPSNIYIKDGFDYKKVFTATRAIEDELPLNYKNIEDNDSTLSNYRIYGQTSRNLLQNTATSQTINGVAFTVNSDGSVTCNGTANNTTVFIIHNFPRFSGECILSGCPMGGSQNTYRLQYTNARDMSYKDYGTGCNIYQFDETQYPLSVISIRIENGYTCNNLTFYPMIRKADIEDDTYEPYGESVGDLETAGEHAGEYKVPVTVSNGADTQTIPIYLPEQIKKVGDEAEYIDYAEQKLHRVRKNLLLNTATNKILKDVTFTVNEDNSVTCNGTASDIIDYRLVGFNSYSLPAGNYCLTGAPQTSGRSTYYLRAWYSSSGSTVGINDFGNGANFTLTDTMILLCAIVIAPQQVLDNVTFYPMIRKADIEDDTYEPYITNTELDVTLPALPTVTGTNTLSVETEVKPSKTTVKGHIK